MEKRIKEYMENINQQYSKYSDYTAHCAELFKELLICDYNDFSSENKQKNRSAPDTQPEIQTASPYCERPPAYIDSAYRSVFIAFNAIPLRFRRPFC